MKKMRVVVGGALLLAAMGVQAHKAGDVILRFGAATVEPHEDSDPVELNGSNVVNGGGATLNANTQLGLTGVYMFTDNIGLELLAATPFRHKISTDNTLEKALGVADIGDVKQLPPTVSVQYYFNNSTIVTPYVGLGVNYTTFFDEDVDADLEKAVGGHSKMDLDDSWGLAAQVGMDVALTENWMLNAAVWYIDIDTAAEIETPAGRIDTNVEVDPFAYMVGVGYKF